MQVLKTKLILLFGAGLLFFCSNVYALNLDSVTLDVIYNANDITKTNLLSVNKSYNATSGVGVFAGGNDDPYSQPNPNFGQIDDGILNGEGPLFDGMEFIDTADLLDIDGDGNATDPGWIHLAHFNPADTPQVVYDAVGSLNIDQVLTLTFTWGTNYTNGTWELAVDPEGMKIAQALLKRSIFDHLAFSLKAANGFAVYDFNFNTIFGLENNPLLNFTTPYVLSGTFKTGDFLNKKGNLQDISHMNVWARDPIEEDTVVPEPATMALLGMGLIALAGISRKTYKRQ